MQRIHSSDNLLLIHHLKNILEAENIDCFIKNEILRGGAGELAPTDTWPELWVKQNLYAQRAAAIVQEQLQKPLEHLPDWVCPACGETLEGQFGACWRCDTVNSDRA